MIKYIFKLSFALTLFILGFQPLFSQTEVEPWGNIKEIRIDSQLMEFESNLSVVKKGWSGIEVTGKEKQRPKLYPHLHFGSLKIGLPIITFTLTTIK